MDRPIVFFSAVLAAGIFAQWLAWRIRFPSILILLTVGFLIGYGCGDDPNLDGASISDEIVTQRLLFPLVSLAVGVIMFEGGLTLRFNELAESGGTILRLVTIGAAVTWGLAALAAFGWMQMAPQIATLTGAILIVTGPTVIAPLLRHVRPYRRIGAIVKWEGIVIDPIGAVLAVLVFEALFTDNSSSVVWQLTKIIAIGLGLGLSAAWILVLMMERYWIPDFLHNSVFLATALGMFTLSNQWMPEAGLLTATIMGVALANQKRITVRHVLEFKENLRVLLISCLFIVLAARISPSDLIALGWGGAAFVIALIVLVRPLSVFLATIGSDLSWRERTFLACLAPRGIVAAAVSSVFALEVAKHPPTAGLPDGHEQIVPLTFLVIVVTVAVYGLAAAPLAKALRLAATNPQGVLFAGAAFWVRRVAQVLQEENISVMLVDTNYSNIAAARMEGLPGHCTSIVSDTMEEVDLGGIGRLLAMTPNDDLNTLAAAEFTPLFGRENVYQLAYRNMSSGPNGKHSRHMAGRYLFDKEATHSRVSFLVAAGATIKKTNITEEFTFEDFKARYGDSAIVLFVINENKQLVVSTIEEPIVPKSGHTVIAMIDPVPEINDNRQQDTHPSATSTRK